MKMKITVIAVLLTMSGAAFATVDCTPGTVGSLSPQCNRPTTNQTFTPRVTVSPTLNNTAVGIGGDGGAGGSGGNASASASAQAGAQGGSVGNVGINVAAARLAQAPDVISYPTAPCRVSIGASGGWFGGAIGFSSSVMDEICSRIETSRHLHNLGAKDAAVQIMCLSDEAKQALEATGVKCLIKAEAPVEPVRP